MDNLDLIRQCFADSIWNKVLVIKNSMITKKEARILKESIAIDVRKYTDLILPNISVKAKKLSDELKVDLIGCEWSKQNKIDPRREKFIFEHFYPVNITTKKCLNAVSVEEIFSILQKETKVVWILREEDDELNRLKYRKNRIDPYKAYNDAKIEIV